VSSAAVRLWVALQGHRDQRAGMPRTAVPESAMPCQPQVRLGQGPGIGQALTNEGQDRHLIRRPGLEPEPASG